MDETLAGPRMAYLWTRRYDTVGTGYIVDTLV